MESVRMCDLLRKVSVFSKNIYVMVLFCGLLLQYKEVSSQGDPSGKEISITYLKVNDQTILTCTVKDLGPRKIIWTKLSEPYPLAIGSTRFTPNRRFSVKVKGNVSTLTIRNVQIRDAGEYQCRLSGQVFVAEVMTLNIKGGEDSTYLLTTDTTVLAQEGSTALLPCEIHNLNDNKVMWKSHKNEIISLQWKLFIGDKRFRVVHDKTQQWSLEIGKIQETDFGTYTCMINSDPVLTRSVALKNAAPPMSSPVLLMDSHFKKKVTVDAGQTVTLTCNFQASPRANVTWYKRKPGNSKPGREKIGEGSVLKLSAVTVEQGGIYICIGENGIKPAAKRTTNLVVIGPPTPAAVIETTTFIPDGPTAPHLYYEIEKTGAKMGSQVQLKCIAVGSPRPEAAWRRHGKILVNNYKYKIESRPELRHALHTVLTIRDIEASDFGDYECRAWNQLGLKFMILQIYEIPH